MNDKWKYFEKKLMRIEIILYFLTEALFSYLKTGTEAYLFQELKNFSWLN